MNNKVHQKWLLELKKHLFKDIQANAPRLSSEHLEILYNGLEPIDDDLEGTIKGLQSIELEGAKYAKINRDLKGAIDDLQKRVKAYALFKQ